MNYLTKVSEQQFKSTRRGTNQHATKNAGLRNKTKLSAWLLSVSILLVLVGIQYYRVTILDAIAGARPLFVSPLPVGVQVLEPTFSPSKDERVNKVHSYLEQFNSPLAPYAQLIVNEADKNDISWTLVVSIAKKESSLGKAILEGSHNAWGVMSWDDQGKRSVRKFSSWTESIAFESKLLAENYRENMNRAIQEKYCPSIECSDTWVATVTETQEAIND